MKNHRAVVAVLLSPLILFQALALPKSNVQQPLIRQQYIDTSDLTIPGDSPVQHCADPTNDLFKISRLDVLPNPPQRYKPFTLPDRDMKNFLM